MTSTNREIQQKWQEWKHENVELEARNVKALSSTVLVVAVWGLDGWRAYCDSVPGINHEKEYNSVLRHGVKIEEQVARSIFPLYDGIPYAK